MSCRRRDSSNCLQCRVHQVSGLGTLNLLKTPFFVQLAKGGWEG